MTREAIECGCAVGRAVNKDGGRLRYAIEVMCFGDPARGIPKVSMREASAWLKANHGIDIKFPSIAYHVQHHCNGAPRLEPVQLPERVQAVVGTTFEEADAAGEQAKSSMQKDIDVLDELVSLSMGVFRHLAAELTAPKPTAEAEPLPGHDPGPKKKRGRALADVQLAEGMGTLVTRAIKLKNDVLHGRKIKLEHGVQSLKGLLPILQQMGQKLEPIEGDRPLLMEQGIDGVFNPASMPRDDDEEDELEVEELDEGMDDDSPDDGSVT
jgi:hypothetical protein